MGCRVSATGSCALCADGSSPTVAQDPASALNPSRRIGDQIREMLRDHRPERQHREFVAGALKRVELPGSEEFQRRYPHQLSGGQQQRVAIAIALACEPPLVVLDEPTTGLDVVTQSRILQEIGRLRAEVGIGVIYVSHDLAVVASIADRIGVMYAGRLVEEGPAAQVLAAPRHPYTRGLVGSIPDHVVPRRLTSMPGVAVGVGSRPSGCAFEPRCAQRIARCAAEMPPAEQAGFGHAVRCFKWQATPALTQGGLITYRDLPQVEVPLLAVERLQAVHTSRDDTVIAARDVSFSLDRGDCLALVGESGSGKTTIARCVVGLHAPTSGEIRLLGSPLAALARDRTNQERRKFQIIFQNPFASLNPRHRAADAIARPARLLRDLSAAEARKEVARLLDRVRLPAAVGQRFPAELSGGERQRVAIARALAATPELLVCDEVTSALDVSVQAAVVELLSELRADIGVAVLFITHDLGLVASIADRVLVLERGLMREAGPVQSVLGHPSDDYTRRLLEAAPRLGSHAVA